MDRPREKRIVKLWPRVCVLISTGQLCDCRLLLTSAKGCSSRCDQVCLRDEAEMRDTWLVSGLSPMVSIAAWAPVILTSNRNKLQDSPLSWS